MTSSDINRLFAGGITMLLCYQNAVYSCWAVCLMQATALQAKLQSLVGGLPDGMSFADWHDGKPMLCITFGSMGPVGAIPDPLHLVEVLVAALRRINAKGVLLTGKAILLIYLQFYNFLCVGGPPGGPP